MDEGVGRGKEGVVFGGKWNIKTEDFFVCVGFVSASGLGKVGNEQGSVIVVVEGERHLGDHS